MPYRSDSSSYYHRGNNDNASSRYSNSDNQPTYSDHSSTSYYDRTQPNTERTYRGDISTQGALDAWAPRRYVPANDYHDPDTFKNPYDRLGQAEQLLHTRGFNAARQTYLRSIDEADGISLTSIREDRHNADRQRVSNRIQKSPSRRKTTGFIQLRSAINSN